MIPTPTLQQAAGSDGQPFSIRGQDRSTHKDPSDDTSRAELPLPGQKTPNDLTSTMERCLSLGNELSTMFKRVEDGLIAEMDGDASMKFDIDMTAVSEERQHDDLTDLETLISQYHGAIKALLKQLDVGSDANTHKEALREGEANPHSESSPSSPTNIPDDAHEGVHGETGDNASR